MFLVVRNHAEYAQPALVKLSKDGMQLLNVSQIALETV